MRDHQHGAGEAGQELLQPGQAVEVEVVGGLVEQQDRRAREQHAGEQRTRRLAARERAERRVERHVGDAQRGARAVELRLQRPAAERAEALLRLAVGGQRGRVVEPLLEPFQLAVQPPHLAERRTEQPVDRQVRSRRLLGQVADPVTRPERDRSAHRNLDAREQAQQGRLAGAVRPDETDAPVARQRQVEPFEDRVVAELGVQVGCRERHESWIASSPQGAQ